MKVIKTTHDLCTDTENLQKSLQENDENIFKFRHKIQNFIVVAANCAAAPCVEKMRLYVCMYVPLRYKIFEIHVVAPKVLIFRVALKQLQRVLPFGGQVAQCQCFTKNNHNFTQASVGGAQNGMVDAVKRIGKYFLNFR